MRGLTLVFALLILFMSRVYAQTGYAHGPDHCYRFEAPQGWTMDNQVAASQGVPMVFFPVGTTWESAPSAMYTRPVQFSTGTLTDSLRIRKLVDSAIEMYRSASENLTARRVRSIHSMSGVSGELWSFSGYSNGGAELVAYFVGRQTVNFFVMQL